VADKAESLMPKTTLLLDCQKLADAVASVGGTVPDKLG
jgi:hypothetical protein